ncbi:ankyrin repeat-containing domain protein [Annulohypoxylon truncatum]|uniref:ankyrin repeat-containing domain protein n=1 Tax=Annulohypoxylon truncatum TaxID=327061 RepID=UPI0020088737|nr:ankyrin repeat-containing domain protein [Annulohypoxylon truncatum]KAI1205893.1 ankyrin repeat-containing domain protein [Annulohypoxylon truncatum]
MAVLTDLPIEVLQEIASNLWSHKDLASLTLTNRKLCCATNYVLYKTFGSYAIDYASEHLRLDMLDLTAHFGHGIHDNRDWAIRQACLYGHVEVVAWLLNHGALVDASVIHCEHCDRYDHVADRELSSLHSVIESRNEDVAILLLSCGAVPQFSQYGPDGLRRANRRLGCCESAIHLAAEFGMPRVVEFLVQRNIFSVDERDHAGRTPLHVAILAGASNTCAKLIELGADLEVEDDQDHCPLTSALVNHRYVQALQLIDAGAKAEPDNVRPGTRHPTTACAVHPYYSGDRPYLFEIEDEYENPPYTDLQCTILSKLVEAGADINRICSDGSTPLCTAVVKGTPHQVSHILDLGADVNARDGQGSTPMNLLWVEGWDHHHEVWCWDKARMLLKAGAELDSRQAWDRIRHLQVNFFACHSWGSCKHLRSNHPERCDIFSKTHFEELLREFWDGPARQTAWQFMEDADLWNKPAF